jgi:hypothetical protein
MPQIRKVLSACTVEAAKRRRICHRDRKNHSIEAGSACLVIKEAGLGSTKNYCVLCASVILDQAADDLQRLRDQLA